MSHCFASYNRSAGFSPRPHSAPNPLAFKQRCLRDLAAAVAGGFLASQNRSNGQFGKGIWIVTDQNLMFPLAVAWSWRDARDAYYHSPGVCWKP